LFGLNWKFKKKIFELKYRVVYVFILRGLFVGSTCTYWSIPGAYPKSFEGDFQKLRPEFFFWIFSLKHPRKLKFFLARREICTPNPSWLYVHGPYINIVKTSPTNILIELYNEYSWESNIPKVFQLEITPWYLRKIHKEIIFS